MFSQEMCSQLSSLASFGMGPGMTLWGGLVQEAPGTPQDREGVMETGKGEVPAAIKEEGEGL